MLAMTINPTVSDKSLIEHGQKFVASQGRDAASLSITTEASAKLNLLHKSSVAGVELKSIFKTGGLGPVHLARQGLMLLWCMAIMQWIIA